MMGHLEGREQGAARIGARFGLTPSDRSQLKIAGAPDDDADGLFSWVRSAPRVAGPSR
jgi:hypothetical protein